MSSEATRAFRALHRAGEPLLLANAWDYASAATLLAAGFAAIGTTSLGVAAAHGIPDGHGRACTETVALARRIGRLGCLFSVDVEAGFSDDPAEVADLAAERATAGAAGINLEDGRPDGTLAPVTRQRDLIAAVKARVPDLFVNARTDTHWLAGDRPVRLADALDRAGAYLAAGADGIFVPGLTDPAGIRSLVAAVDAPVNILYAPAGPTVQQLADLGVGRISYGSLLFRVALHAAAVTALSVARGGPVPDGVPGPTSAPENLRRPTGEAAGRPG